MMLWKRLVCDATIIIPNCQPCVLNQSLMVLYKAGAFWTHISLVNIDVHRLRMESKLIHYAIK